MSLSDKMVFLTGRSMGKSTHLHFVPGNETIFLTADDVREAVKELKGYIINSLTVELGKLLTVEGMREIAENVERNIDEIFGEKLCQ